jgi:4-alpha-glucanotransferase
MVHNDGPSFSRASGILLHLTSLPGRCGIGDLGPAAYRFVDFLATHQQHLWQVLPLGPTSQGVDYSPYVALSAFAGNPLLISIEALVEENFLPASVLHTIPPLPEGFTDYPEASRVKTALCRLASQQFDSVATATQKTAFAEFGHQQQWWLDDYALFMALRETFHETSWNTWEPDIAQRETPALRTWQEKLAPEVLYYKHEQFFFFRQWHRLKHYANQRGVKIIGDLPIYVGFDSAEVWAHPELFQLDPDTRAPLRVAGVPPDYFSATGQRWGNPLYRWHDEHDRLVDGVAEWWVRRIRATFAMVDLVRIDHFRGFEAYWSIAADEETAVNGHWVKGPGATLFSRVRTALGELPVIAEDLGVITPEVEALRLQFGFPGMKILQFAFGGDARNPYLPHNYPDSRYVVYTGTHDNDTTCGWFHSARPETQGSVLRYLDRAKSDDLHWQLIRFALSSVAALAVIPLQDVLGLGSEGRMNLPGQPQGNWRWRYLPDVLRPELGERLAELTVLYGRKQD